MGGVRSKVARVFRNYNVESRAHRVIEQRQSPAGPAAAAPRHPSTADRMDRFRDENPELLEAVNTKYESLHDRLKTVYVDSQGDNPEIQRSSAPAASAPQLSRAPVQEAELGSMEVDYQVPVGRVSLRQALELLALHQSDPQTHTAAALALQANLDTDQMQDIITHFKVLRLHIPKEMYAQNKNMKKLVQDQLEHGKSYMTQNLHLPSDEEIWRTREDMAKLGPGDKQS